MMVCTVATTRAMVRVLRYHWTKLQLEASMHTMHRTRSTSARVRAIILMFFFFASRTESSPPPSTMTTVRAMVCQEANSREREKPTPWNRKT